MVDSTLDKILGNPTSLTKLEKEPPSSQSLAQVFSFGQPPLNPEKQAEPVKKPVPVAKPVTYDDSVQDQANNNYMPIKALSTFTNDWIIKARVSSKQMRGTQKGGHLLKLELVDNFGTMIEGTFFNDCALQFDPLV